MNVGSAGTLLRAGILERHMESLDFDDDLNDQSVLDTGIDSAQIEAAVLAMLRAFGENPDREGLKRTPQRVARMDHELPTGYRADPQSLVTGAVFTVAYDKLGIVRAI